MKLSYEITREDYADFNKFHFIKNRLTRTIITGSLTIILLQYVLNKDHFDLKATIFSSAVCISVYLLIYYLSLSRTKKIPADNGTILGHRDMEFTDNEIFCNTKYTNTKNLWTTAKKLESSKTAFYLYVDTNMAYIIPKRIFHTTEESNEFEQFILTKIKTTA